MTASEAGPAQLGHAYPSVGSFTEAAARAEVIVAVVLTAERVHRMGPGPGLGADLRDPAQVTVLAEHTSSS